MLTNDFFAILLEMSTAWKPSAASEGVYERRNRVTGEVKWAASAVDLA